MSDKRYSTPSGFVGTLRYEWRARKAWRSKRAALVGAWWWLVRRYPGELCEDCGKPYGRSIGLWRAPDDLWVRVVGSVTGTLCPTCFTNRCEASSILVRWEAMRVEVAQKDRMQPR